jgi:hypothetical protein
MSTRRDYDGKPPITRVRIWKHLEELAKRKPISSMEFEGVQIHAELWNDVKGLFSTPGVYEVVMELDAIWSGRVSVVAPQPVAVAVAPPPPPRPRGYGRRCTSCRRWAVLFVHETHEHVCTRCGEVHERAAFAFDYATDADRAGGGSLSVDTTYTIERYTGDLINTRYTLRGYASTCVLQLVSARVERDQLPLGRVKAEEGLLVGGARAFAAILEWMDRYVDFDTTTAVHMGYRPPARKRKAPQPMSARLPKGLNDQAIAAVDLGEKGGGLEGLGGLGS